eukprot:jgi/Chrpa1/12025/Chrysochromulina_OHIO_Genome00017277-RA
MMQGPPPTAPGAHDAGIEYGEIQLSARGPSAGSSGGARRKRCMMHRPPPTAPGAHDAGIEYGEIAADIAADNMAAHIAAMADDMLPPPPAGRLAGQSSSLTPYQREQVEAIAREEAAADIAADNTDQEMWGNARLVIAIITFLLITDRILPKEAVVEVEARAEAEPRMYAKSSASPSGSGGARVRILHLSLADSDRRARLKLDENTGWEIFLAGCRERLQVKNIRRVTDSSGEAILAVEELVHDDHLVIYATKLAAGEVANSDSTDVDLAQDIGPVLPLPMAVLSEAAVERVLLKGDGDAPLPNATDDDGAARGGSTARVKRRRASAAELLQKLDAVHTGGAVTGAGGDSSAGAGARGDGSA